MAGVSTVSQEEREAARGLGGHCCHDCNGSYPEALIAVPCSLMFLSRALIVSLVLIMLSLEPTLFLTAPVFGSVSSLLLTAHIYSIPRHISQWLNCCFIITAVVIVYKVLPHYTIFYLS